MALTAEQSRALVDAIATAASPEALAELRHQARREHLLDLGGGFLEQLIALRVDTLRRGSSSRTRIA